MCAMSELLPRDQFPPGLDKDNFVPLDAVDFRNGYATFVQGLAGMLPDDPNFPAEYQDAVTGHATPLEDTPTKRATHGAAKRFTDDAKRVSFLWRLQNVMPLAQDKKYAKYRNDETGTMHIALLTAVAATPCNARSTRKVQRALLAASFQAVLTMLREKDYEP
jgi:hypothetical protein